MRDSYLAIPIRGLTGRLLDRRYGAGKKLAGVLYLHRIGDNRMGGMSRRNFISFRRLCGDAGLKNVVIVTTMWSAPAAAADRAREEKREAQLAGSELFFKHAVEKGARMARHDGGAASARALLRMLLQGEEKALRVQEEMVEEKKPLARTEVGEGLQGFLEEKAAAHRKDMEQVKEQYREETDDVRGKVQETVKEIDETREAIVELQKELAEVLANLRQQLEQVNSQLQQLSRVRADIDTKMQALAMAIGGVVVRPGTRRVVVTMRRNTAERESAQPAEAKPSAGTEPAPKAASSSSDGGYCTVQ